VARTIVLTFGCDPSNTRRVKAVLSTHGALDVIYDDDSQKLQVSMEAYGLGVAERACEHSRLESWVSDCVRKPVGASSWVEWCARKGLKT
jgi:hypothetical protein